MIAAMKVPFLFLAALCPAVAMGKEYFVAQSRAGASDANPGTAQRPFLTISAAAKVAGPGDTVTIISGVYRESVILRRGGEAGRPVVYQAAPGAEALIKGSELVTNWTRGEGHYMVPAAANVWYAPAPKLKGRAGAFVFRREQVFIDGKLVEQAPTADALKQNTFTVQEAEGKLLLCLPAKDEPARHTIEISTRECLWGSAEPTGHVVLRGLRFSHGANDPESLGVSIERCHDWLLEDLEVTWLNGAGIRVGGSSDCTLRRVRANYNGCTGISGVGATGLRLEHCQTHFNNQKGYPVGWESGGVKLLVLKNSLITDHQSCSNAGFGIWLDWACQSNRVTRSVALGNTQAGFNLEASRGPTWVDNCIAAFNGSKDSFWNSGFYGHDSDNLRLAHNLAYGNLGYGIRLRLLGGRTNNFDGKPVSCRGNRIANNILCGNGIAGVFLPADGPETGGNCSNGNLFSPGAAGALEHAPSSDKAWEEFESRLPAGIVEAGQQFSEPVKLRSLAVPLAFWRRLTGNDRDSTQAVLRLRDPAAADFRPAAGQVIPLGLPLEKVLAGTPPESWGTLPWSADKRNPVGPF